LRPWPVVIGRRDVEDGCGDLVSVFGDGVVDQGLNAVGPVLRDVVYEGAEKERSR